MSEIAIRLDPAFLANPDADLRYELPEALVTLAPQLLSEDGYDYDAANRMLIFLSTELLDQALVVVLDALERLDLRGNRFSPGPGVVVAVADETHCSDLARYRLVAPTSEGSLLEADGP